MLRHVALAAMLCGCNAIFGVDDLGIDAGKGGSPGVGGAGGGGGAGAAEGGGGVGGDGGAILVGGMGGSGGQPLSALCDAPDLVACYSFDGTALDGSPGARHLTTTAVTYEPGVVGQAVRLDATSLMTVPADAGLSPAALTIEAWVWLDAPVASGRVSIIDHGARWALFILPSELRYGSNVLLATYTFPAQVWTHVAATADIAQTVIYVNGTAIATGPGQALNTTPSTELIHVGSNAPPGNSLDLLVGAIDNLRVFSVVRTPEQICAAAKCR